MDAVAPSASHRFPTPLPRSLNLSLRRVKMDSGGNSGNSSMQSSSGGDDEFDSRTDAQPPPPFFSQLTKDMPELLLPLPHHQHPSPNFNLHHHSTFDNDSQPLLSRDLPWSTHVAGADIPTLVARFTGSSSSTSIAVAAAAPQGTDAAVPAEGPVVPPPESNTQPRRPNRKRTRASRRAPTTVLATDTHNFRAMVQQYTGIPVSPYSNPARRYSNRLDLISSPRSSWSAGIGGGGGNIFRPSVDNLHALSTSSSSSSCSSSTTALLPFPSLAQSSSVASNVDGINIFSNFEFSTNYQFSPPNFITFPRMPQSFDAVVPSQLSFQSLLSSQLSPLQYGIGSRAGAAADSSSLCVPLEAERGLGLSHEHVHGHHPHEAVNGSGLGGSLGTGPSLSKGDGGGNSGGRDDQIPT